MTSPLRITINSMAYGAAGVGRSEEGKVIFVPKTAPGDVVDVELTHQTASYSEGIVQTIVEPSPLRVKPICPHADVCGGCPWMHLSYSAQLEAKRANV
ncbi:MAG: TRAM domain-containing protein, partial [Eggerthellaceae bacterium]|nr:TRAM domain-containing protein [Eggerthellaceae bacterium]